jgi:hypothetical protein
LIAPQDGQDLFSTLYSYDHDADIIPPATLVRERHELLAGAIWVALLKDAPRDLLVAHMVDQPIRAE